MEIDQALGKRRIHAAIKEDTRRDASLFCPHGSSGGHVHPDPGCTPGTRPASTINPNATTAIADYRLTVNGGLPVPAADISGPQVVAMVAPTGGVVPPTNADGTQGSPLTVLSDSSGFDPNQLVVALKDATSNSGAPSNCSAWSSSARASTQTACSTSA